MEVKCPKCGRVFGCRDGRERVACPYPDCCVIIFFEKGRVVRFEMPVVANNRGKKKKV